ncbi:MAG TPA: hypothetical protein VHJ19_05730, partial [Gammaproteobacteria bacterium]|nr:hypothetical protein [Gammaproteobacteria bacterium]
FWTGVLSAFSFPVAAWLSRRIGLINTMVCTHLPTNVFLMLVPFMPTLPLATIVLLLRLKMFQICGCVILTELSNSQHE